MEQNNDERIEKLVDTIVEDLENMGLYCRGVNVMGQAESEEFNEDVDIREMISAGEASFAIVGMWQIGDVAWQDKILNPDAYDQDKQFSLMMPSREELMADKAAEAIAAGLNIFDIDFDYGELDEDQTGS